MEASVASLRTAAAQGRATIAAGARLMDVPPPLVTLFPEGGIRRGSTVSVVPMMGGASLALAMAGTVTGRGGWAAVVGWASLGLAAAVELGVDLRRLALVPAPGEHWAAVVAALVDGFELLVVRPPGRPRVGDARRLAARVRERGAVMVLVDPAGWPETPDITLTASRPVWDGLGPGHGCLTGRRMEIVSSGRRSGGRERRREVWLPAPAGVAGVPAAGVPAAGVPVAGVPVAGVPVAGVPVAGVPVAGAPVPIRPGGGYPAVAG